MMFVLFYKAFHILHVSSLFYFQLSYSLVENSQGKCFFQNIFVTSQTEIVRKNLKGGNGHFWKKIEVRKFLLFGKNVFFVNIKLPYLLDRDMLEIVLDLVGKP